MERLSNAANVNLQEFLNDFEKEVFGLITQLWALTSDFLPSEEDLFVRARAWGKVVKPLIFDKYLNYTIKACLISRDRKGPIHADEFMQVWVLVKSGQVWSTAKREWIGVYEQIQAIYDQRAEYELNRRDFPDPPEAIQERIKAQIYGWEE